MTNEAAERLLRFLEPEDRIHAKTLLDAALAAERRATVERIRAALEGLGGWRDPRYSGMFESKGLIGRADALAILDAEAA